MSSGFLDHWIHSLLLDADATNVPATVHDNRGMTRHDSFGEAFYFIHNDRISYFAPCFPHLSQVAF